MSETNLDQCIVASAKKDYSEFETIVNQEVEAKMKKYLGGFQDYLEKNAFNVNQPPSTEPEELTHHDVVDDDE